MTEPLWRRDQGRFVNKRARYLERAANLERKKARVVVLSELGYSTSGIATELGCAAGTADGYLTDVAERFGPTAAQAKAASDLAVDAPLGKHGAEK